MTLCTYWHVFKRIRRIRRGYITNLDDASKTIFRDSKISGKNFRLIYKKRYQFRRGISLGSHRSKIMVRTSKADGEITDNDIKRLIAQSGANF